MSNSTVILLGLLILILIVWTLLSLIFISIYAENENDSPDRRQQKHATKQQILLTVNLTAFFATSCLFAALGPIDVALSYLRKHWIFSLFIALFYIFCIGINYLNNGGTITWLICLAPALIFVQIATNDDYIMVSTMIASIGITIYAKIKALEIENKHKIIPWKPKFVKHKPAK